MWAIHLLEGVDADIPQSQQAALIAVIGLKGNEHFLKFYVNMPNKVRRCAFIVKLIGEPVDAGVEE
jgi:hypothetical protein